MIERLRAQYLERAAENGISTEMFDAVLATRPRLAAGFRCAPARAGGLHRAPEGASLAAANKRIANILRKSDPAQLRPVERDAAARACRAALHQATLQALRAPVVEAIQSRGVRRSASSCSRRCARRSIAFFERVLVNDPDAALRDNRFAAAGELRALFAGIADLSRLPG